MLMSIKEEVDHCPPQLIPNISDILEYEDDIYDENEHLQQHERESRKYDSAAKGYHSFLFKIKLQHLTIFLSSALQIFIQFFTITVATTEIILCYLDWKSSQDHRLHKQKLKNMSQETEENFMRLGTRFLLHRHLTLWYFDVHSLFLIILSILAMKRSYDNGITSVRHWMKKIKRQNHRNSYVTTRKKSTTLLHKNKNDHFGSFAFKLRLFFIFITTFIFCLASRIIFISYFSRHGSVNKAIEYFIIHSTQLFTKVKKKRTSSPACREFDHGLHSIIEIVFFNLFTQTTLILSRIIRQNTFKISKHIAISAVTNPFLFHFHLQKIFTALKFAKLYGPMIGVSNKLKGHISDTRTKVLQRNKAKKANFLWNILFQSLQLKMKEQKRENAVRVIQYAFRRYRTEKMERKLKLLRSSRMWDHSSKSPHVKAIYKRLEEKLEQNIQRTSTIQSFALDMEIQRMKNRELTAHDKQTIKRFTTNVPENRRFLLRPNTVFSVGWKLITVICVFIELSNVVIQDKITNEIRSVPLRLAIESLQQKLVSVNKPFCYNGGNDNNFSFRYYLPLLIQDQQKTKCQLINLNESLLRLTYELFQVLQPLVNLVSFMDVFVTFFTGDIDSKGHLIPKSSISRYVFPGVGLQLFVNPTMKVVRSLMQECISFALATGISRIVHAILIIMPLMRKISKYLLCIIYAPFEDDYSLLFSNFLK